MKWINYNKKLMSLSFEWKWKGKQHYKFLTCPFATWWKARKYFVRPKFNFYFGPMWKYLGKKESKFGQFDDYKFLGGYWPFASIEYLKQHTSKWFPIYIISHDIGWKSKWNSPRYETPGCFTIFFGRDYRKHWQFSFVVTAPKTFIYDCTVVDQPDNYWESMLSYLYFTNRCKSDREKLLKTRKQNQSHWSTSKSTDVNKFKILSTRTEKILNNEYFVVSLKSEYISNLLFWEFGLTQKIELSITVTKGEQTRIAHSKFVNNLDNNVVDIYFQQYSGLDDFISLFKSNYDNIELCKSEHIDLGPAFKDQFLNKRGIKLIQDEYKRNKENGS